MYRGRFAPTPSGELHLGSLVTAVASFLDARAAGGEWLLRIEDVDAQRCRPQFESSILSQLERHGLTWDGPVVRQRDRAELYIEALSELNRRGFVYPCTCSRNLLKSRGCEVNADGEFIYPGFCKASKSVPPTVNDFLAAGVSTRFTVGPECVDFLDLWQGHQTCRVDESVGDFQLRRNDGCFAYHLAVTVDDFVQGITHVVRGMDILPLTARHILLQRALGYTTPAYLHVPLVRGAAGEKLSKSASARSLKMTEATENLLWALEFLGIPAREFGVSECSELLRCSVVFWASKCRCFQS